MALWAMWHFIQRFITQSNGFYGPQPIPSRSPLRSDLAKQFVMTAWRFSWPITGILSRRAPTEARTSRGGVPG